MDFSLETTEILESVLSFWLYPMIILNLQSEFHSAYGWDGILSP